MKHLVAALMVRAPDGREWRIELDRDRLTVGRPTPASRPDVELAPDEQRWVGRLHCTLERSAGIWSVSDNATVNGTLLRRNGVTDRILGRARLQHGDAICILGDLTEDGQSLYWQLTFVDPFTTQPSPLTSSKPSPRTRLCLEYDWVQARVFRREGEARKEITGVRPQAHQLLRYMADLSLKNGGTPIACSYAQLIRALWGEPEEWPAYRAYTEQDVRSVVADLRQRIEPDPSDPRLLETVRGFGYRLVMCPQE